MNTIEYKKITDIEIYGKLEKQIGYKPFGAIIVGIVAGIGLIALRNVSAIILGCFFLIIGLVTLFLTKDYKTMDIYDTGVLIYNSDDLNLAIFLPYDEIEQWTIKRDNGANEAIYFRLYDGKEIYKNTFQSAKAFRCLRDYISDKEKMNLKGKQVSSKISSPFKNIFKKK